MSLQLRKFGICNILMITGQNTGQWFPFVTVDNPFCTTIYVCLWTFNQHLFGNLWSSLLLLGSHSEWSLRIWAIRRFPNRAETADVCSWFHVLITGPDLGTERPNWKHVGLLPRCMGFRFYVLILFKLVGKGITLKHMEPRSQLVIALAL